MDLEILHSTVRISTPLIFAALGGLVTYEAGMLNIALDGFMIVAAFTGIAAAYFSGSLSVAILAAIGASMLLAALMALFNIRLRAHIFIVGTAVTFLAYGLTALLLKGVFGQDALFTSDTIPTFPNIDIPVVNRFLAQSDLQRSYASRLCRLSDGASGFVGPLPYPLGTAAAGGGRGSGGRRDRRKSTSTA